MPNNNNNNGGSPRPETWEEIKARLEKEAKEK